MATGRSGIATAAKSLLGFILPLTTLSGILFLHGRLTGGLDPLQLSEGMFRTSDVWKLPLPVLSGRLQRPNNESGEGDHFPARPDVTLDTAALKDTWIDMYFRFHADARRKFPGASILTDPAAPGVLVRFCGHGGRTRNYFCGGLSDRLSTLPFDIFLANATGRVLLVWWEIPHPLESFLVPSGSIDWTFPGGGKNEDAIGRFPNFDVGFDFILKDKFPPMFEAALRNLLDSKDRVYKISSPATGYGNKFMEDQLTSRSFVPGGNKLFEPPLFGAIFRRLFRPSRELQVEIDDVMARNGLRPGHYSAVHLRLRHPLGWGKRVVGRDGNTTADRSGLPFSGAAKSFAIKVATNAIECAVNNPSSLLKSNSSAPEPLYLFSDSNDTVSLFVDPKASPFAGHHKVKITSRDVSSEALHLAYDKSAHHPPSSFFGMFVDLFVAIGARCITYDGIGGFGALAWRISGTNCTARHREIGGNSPKAKSGSGFCRWM